MVKMKDNWGVDVARFKKDDYRPKPFPPGSLMCSGCWTGFHNICKGEGCACLCRPILARLKHVIAEKFIQRFAARR